MAISNKRHRVRLVTKIYRIFNSIQNGFDALFFQNTKNQFWGIIISVIALLIGYFICDGYWMSFWINIGTSLLIASLFLKFFLKKKMTSVTTSGLVFIGDREQFQTLYKNKKQSLKINGWNNWIEETPYGGEIIIIGQKNSYWTKHSSFQILNALKRNIEVKFIFVGTENDVKKNYDNFWENDKNGLHTYNNLKCFMHKIEIKDYKEFEDNVGFYWNGKTLLIKLYLPKIDNVKCPLLCFSVPGTGYFFDFLDFEYNLLLHNGKCVKTFAESFNEIYNRIQLIQWPIVQNGDVHAN